MHSNLSSRLWGLIIAFLISFNAVAADSYHAKYQRLLNYSLYHSSGELLKQWLGKERSQKQDIQKKLRELVSQKIMMLQSEKASDDVMSEDMMLDAMLEDTSREIAIGVLAALQISEDALKMDIGTEEVSSMEEAMTVDMGSGFKPQLTREEAAPCSYIGGEKLQNLSNYFFLPGRNVDSSISFNVQAVTGARFKKEIFALKMNGRIISQRVRYHKTQVQWSPMIQMKIYGENEEGESVSMGMRTSSGDTIEFKANKDTNLSMSGNNYIYVGKKTKSGAGLNGVKGTVKNFAIIEPSGREPACVFITGVSGS